MFCKSLIKSLGLWFLANKLDFLSTPLRTFVVTSSQFSLMSGGMVVPTTTKSSFVGAESVPCPRQLSLILKSLALRIMSPSCACVVEVVVVEVSLLVE